MKPLEIFYDESIRNKILKCDLKASQLKRGLHCLKHQAEISRAQAAFFEDNKEQLIQQMLTHGVGRDLAKINASLMIAFVRVFPARAFSAENNGPYLEVICEGTGPLPAKVDHAGTFRLTENPCRQFAASDRSQYLYDLPWADGSLISDDD